MSNVIEVQPKTVRGEHHGQPYTIKYERHTETWRWHFEKPATIPFDGNAKNLHTAEREVKKKIEQVLA